MGKVLLTRYQELLQVYQAHDVCRNGEFSDYSSTDAVCFKRHNNQKSLWCLVNTKNNSYHINVPNELQGMQTAELLSGQDVVFSNQIQLSNYQIQLYVLE